MKKNFTLALILAIYASQAQMKFFNYTCPNTVTCIADDGNYFWAGTAGGFYKWNKNGTLVAKFTTQNGLPDNNVTSIKTDDISGGFWVGTFYGGVAYFNGTSWTTYNEADGLADFSILSIAIDLQGNKWFGTYKGLSKFDGTNWTTYTSADGLSLMSRFIISNSIYTVNIDAQGNKWFGTNNGVSKFDGTNWTTYKTSAGLVNNNVSSIIIDGLGNKDSKMQLNLI